MRKLLAILMLQFALSSALPAATGDITPTISADGWSAYFNVAGFTTGATYSFGMIGNSIPGANTPYFTVVSLGYDNTGAATTITRTVYCTKVVRFPYGTGYLTGTAGLGTFVDGETVTQAVSGATGIVVGSQSSSTKLVFFVTSGTFNNVNLCTGGTSSATFTSTSAFTTYAVNTNNEEVSGSNMVVRVALSDYIFQKDNTGGGNSGTAPTFTAPSGFIVNAGGGSQNSTTSSAIAVTNSSTAAYPRCIANWSRPGNERITGNFPVAVIAAHGVSAWNGGTQIRPGTLNIAAVVFSAADTHGHPFSTTSTGPIYDSTYGDAVPVGEHKGTIDVSTLTQGDVLTVNFKAYPLIGDSGSIVDSSDGVNTQPTPLYAPITFLNDKSGVLGTCALVDPAGSDSGANTVYDSASFDPLTAYQFKTIPKAVSAIADYNNTHHSRNCAAGGAVFCNAGSYSLAASGLSYGSMTPDCLVTITRAPAATRAGVIITTNGSDFTIGGSANTILKVLDVAITSSTNFLFYNQLGVWLDQCNLTLSGVAQVFVTPQLWVTRCNVTEFDDGIGPYTDSSSTTAPAIVRGNNLNGFNQSILSYMAIGNLKTDATTSTNVLFTLRRWPSQNPPNTANGVIAFNKILKWTSSNIVGPTTATGFVNSHGYAVVQNVFEFIGPAANPVIDLSLDTIATNNFLIWNNVFLGERCNIGYNSSGSTSYAKNFWSIKNDLMGDWNIKSDTFASSPDGRRIGNWPIVNGVGCSGVVHAENVSGDGASGDFLSDFSGLSSIQPATTGQPPSGTGFSDNYFAFTNDQSWHSGSATSGGGDYSLNSASPVKALARDFLVPADIAGTARSASDASGAYHYGPTLVSPFFWFYP